MTIYVKNLSKSFKNKQVLKDINLKVDKSEIFALMGPNGSGKTTFLKILATLVSPDSGSVEICNLNASAYPEKVKSKIGLVCDADRSFYQILTIEDNMNFFAGIMGITQNSCLKRVNGLFESFNLNEWRKTRLSHCPSGIKQKLAIIRALIHNPEVLLVDEPTRSLDEESRKTILAFLSDEVKRGKKACIMVTHDINEAKKTADNAGFLENGIVRQV
jgi:ABC-2 type transport system ATP-binding protein